MIAWRNIALLLMVLATATPAIAQQPPSAPPTLPTNGENSLAGGAAPTAAGTPVASPAGQQVPDVGPTFWFPEQASTLAPDVDGVFIFITWLSAFFFVLIVGVMVWFAWRYRGTVLTKATSNVTHNTPLELTWTIVPLILVIAIFYVGMEGYLNIRRPPIGAYEIHAKAQRWSWTFEYPNGASETNQLYVPVNRPVKVTMESSDVLHSLYLPALRVKQDVVPGRYTFIWFEATKVGDFDLFCAEYCGKDHSQMAGRLHVLSEEDFEAELERLASEYLAMTSTQLAEYALKKLYPRCSSCHTLDGSDSTGPSWKDTHALWVSGKPRVFADGSSAPVDENYIRESIMFPQRHIVQGRTGAMPTFQGQLKDQQIRALILAIKNLDKFDLETGKLTVNIDNANGGGQSPKPQPDSDARNAAPEGGSHPQPSANEISARTPDASKAPQ